MAVSLKHKFANPKSDTPDTTVARASDWNDEHDLTLAANRVLGRKTAGTGSVEELTGADVRAIADVEQAGVVAGINTRTSSYTLALSDRGKVIEMDVATANTVTVPNEAGLSGVDFPIGTRIVVVQKGTGATTLIPAPGVTVLTSATELGTTSRYSSLVLYKRAANEWVMEKPIDYEAAAAESAAAALASEINAANSATSAASSAAAAGAASGRLVVATFSDLATVFGYSSSGGRRAVAAGDLISVLDIDATYRVLASGAAGSHLDYTGAGGVKLNVLPKTSGYDVKAFGAVGDGSADDTVAIQNAINAAIDPSATVRRVIFNTKHVITDIDITKKYFCGLVIEGQNTTHQPSPNVATLIVSGSTSQGIDLSGTSGVVIRNISIRGSASSAPRCGIFAQRVSGSPESYGHIFDNVRIFGNYSKAGVYNYAGEFWDFRNCFLWCEGGGGRAFYGTSTNSLAVASKFQTPDNTATPLTITSFRRTSIKSTAVEAVWFEQQSATSGDRTIQNILFDGCYTIARGNAPSVFRFSDCSGGLTIKNCTDESYATGDNSAADVIVKIDGSRQFQRLTISNNVFYTKNYVIDAVPVVDGYIGENNWVSSGANKTWRFSDLRNAVHRTLYENEKFIAVSAFLVSVQPSTRAAAGKIQLPSNRMNHAYDVQVGGSPQGVINPEVRGRLIFDTWYNQAYVSIGTPAAVDSFGWRPLGDKDVQSSLPTSGNYVLGQIIWKAVTSIGGKIGWVCVSTGTLGTLSGVTGSISSGLTTLTVNDVSSLALGNLISIAGITGNKVITDINGTTVTINSPADASVSNAAIAYVAPVFKEWGAIDP